MSKLTICAFRLVDKVAYRLLILPARSLAILFRQDSVWDQRIEQRFRNPTL